MGLFDRMSRGIAGALGEAREYVAAAVAFTTLANSSAVGDEDYVEGYQSEPDEPPMPSHQVRRLSPWGITGRPVDGVLAGVVRALGGAAQGLMVGIATPRYGRQNLQRGETQIYNSVDGCEAFFDRFGNIKLNTPTGEAVPSVIVNGGTARVACHGDAVKAKTAMATWMRQVEAAINLLAPGSITPLSSTFTTSPGIGEINVTASRRFTA